MVEDDIETGSVPALCSQCVPSVFSVPALCAQCVPSVFSVPALCAQWFVSSVFSVPALCAQCAQWCVSSVCPVFNASPASHHPHTADA